VISKHIEFSVTHFISKKIANIFPIGYDDQFTMTQKQQEDRLLKAVYPTGSNKREGHDM